MPARQFECIVFAYIVEHQGALPQYIKENMIDDRIFERITLLSEEGNQLGDEERYDEAIEKFSEALELVPEPKRDWEAGNWLSASIGDMYFLKGDHKEALEYFYDAYVSPEEAANPFINMRIGQCLLETGDAVKAKEFLMRTYMTEGEKIFSGEDEKYFAHIKDSI